MVEFSVSKNVENEEGKECNLHYLLLSNGPEFDLECYLGEKDSSSESNYCYVRDFTRNRNKALEFVEKLAQSDVFPVHIRDIIEDMMS